MIKILIALLISSVCFADDPDPTPTPSPTPKPIVIQVFPGNVCSLTSRPIWISLQAFNLAKTNAKCGDE